MIFVTSDECVNLLSWLFKNVYRLNIKLYIVIILTSIVDKSMRYKRGTGSCVLFILDFSGSMQGSGIISLKQGVFDILDGKSLR